MSQFLLKGLCVLVFLAYAASSAVAMEISEYDRLKNESRDLLTIHIYGVGSGYSWSNSLLDAADRKPFYCPPQKIALNANNYMDILEKQIAKLKAQGKFETPVELALFFGLLEAFPCSEE